jgi:hypothetical protein
MVTVEFQGLPEIQNRLAQLTTILPPRFVQAAQQEAEQILDQSIPLVPVDTGLLVSSGIVEEQANGADIRYGGHGLAPYAIRIHEDTQLNHPNGGQHSFLREPFYAATAGMLARLAAAVGRG